ncbi:Agc protein kinase [Globisporangium polare]
MRAGTSVSAPSSPPPRSHTQQQRAARWSASQLDDRVHHHYHHRRGEYTSTGVVNARAQVFGHRDHGDDVYFNLIRARNDLSDSESNNSSSSSAHSDTESESSVQQQQQQRDNNKSDNLVMLASTLDPTGRKIRRVTTEVVDADEQLLLVKRRASAAKAIALRNYQQSSSTSSNNSNSSTSKRQPRNQWPECDRNNKGALPPVTPADFAYLKVIGVGAWGKVVLVRNRHDAKLYAMKVISKRAVKENNLAEKILSERDVLGGTYHHALVHLHWAFQTKTSLYLVMDYCPGGELSVHLHEAERFSEEVTTFYAAEIVLALEHLHRQGIIYRDLKPENLLLTASGHLKLVDFGISKFGITDATMGATTMCGSYEYLAPEVFVNKEYGTAVDWWSFGVVVYEMLTGLPPWYSQNPHVMRKHILKKPLVFPSYVSEEARDLLRKLLHRDPLRRLGSRDGSAEVKRHAFFRNLDWQMVTFREIFPPIQPCGSPQSIENATNFDVEFTRLSVGSVDASSSQAGSVCDEFTDFNFEAPEAPHIEYGYARDLGVMGSAGMCA